MIVTVPVFHKLSSLSLLYQLQSPSSVLPSSLTKVIHTMMAIRSHQAMQLLSSYYQLTSILFLPSPNSQYLSRFHGTPWGCHYYHLSSIFLPRLPLRYHLLQYC
jgi:hypothetical protein